LSYRLSLFEKLKIFNLFLKTSIDKVFILSPKNFFFYLPFFFKKKRFFGVTVKEKNKDRPIQYLSKFLFKFRTNNRKVKKKADSIKNIIEDLCSNDLSSNIQLINTKSKNNFDFEIFSQKKYCHFHFKKLLYEKKKWSFSNLNSFLNILIKNKYKVFLTSDIEKNEFNKIFKDKFKTINFENNNESTLSSNLIDDIIYLENIESLDLFNLIKNASLVVSPHGTMTVMASYLKVPVLDIFDNTINKIAFYEYKPENKNYKFMILKSFSERQLVKIERLLSND